MKMKDQRMKACKGRWDEIGDNMGNWMMVENQMNKREYQRRNRN